MQVSLGPLLIMLVLPHISKPLTSAYPGLLRELSVLPMNIYYGSTASEAGGVFIIYTSDGGMLLAGNSEQNGTKDLLVIKINAAGVVQWA